jgi:hypothetical protein
VKRWSRTRNNPISDDDSDDSSTSSRSECSIASSDENNESDNNSCCSAGDDSEGSEIIDNETMSNIEVPLTIKSTTTRPTVAWPYGPQLLLKVPLCAELLDHPTAKQSYKKKQLVTQSKIFQTGLNDFVWTEDQWK